MKNTTAEILCIGTELLMGDIVNTNAAYLAKELTGLGIHLYHQTVVGDNPQRLAQSVRLALSRSDVLITTGGLGPTYDDLTKETIAAAMGCPLELHQPSLEQLEAFFARLGREMTDNNRKQAMLPRGAEVFDNPNGTAPGCAIHGQGELAGKLAILLPGPPREMRPMFQNHVKPLLLRDSGSRLYSTNLHFFGIGESMLEHRLHDLMTHSLNPTVAPYAKTGEVLLRLTASIPQNAPDSQAQALIAPVLEQIRQQAGEFLYGVDVGDLQTAAVQALLQRGLRVATAESCTGGYLSKRLTDVSGSSQVFEYGVCCYSNRAKQLALGVSPQTLSQHGAVSPQAAGEMAAAVRRLSGADIGVATTGNAGPQPSEGKPVGLVYLAVDSQRYSQTLTLQIHRRDQDSREYIRYLASSHALHLILRAAQSWPPQDTQNL